MTEPTLFQKEEIREARARIRRAITNLLSTKMLFGTLTLNLMPPLPDPERLAIASDGRNLRYNPQWVSQADTEQISFAIARCALATGLAHHTRRQNRSYPRWQEASRQVTLPLMREHGFPTREPGLNMSVEQAYEKIPEPPEEDGDSASSPSPQPGQQPQQGDSKPEPARSDPRQQGEIMDAPPPPRQDSPQEGNNSAKGQQGQEPQHMSQLPEYRPQAQREEQERKEEQQRWKTRLKQAVQLAKAQGHEIGSMQEIIHADEQPRLDWTEQIRPFMEDTAPTQTSWSIPNPRFAASGKFMPGKRAYHMEHICFAVDSSASMSVRELGLVWAEIKAAVSTLEPEYIRVIQCDVVVQEDRIYQDHEVPEELIACGRGGTRFSPVFDLIDEAADVPACLIYMTDLGSNDFPDPPPGYAVLWICTDPENPTQPPFGERIDITE